MKSRLLSKWTILYFFLAFNLITAVFFLLINVSTTYFLKESQSNQVFLENRNNIILTDYRSLQKSLGLRVKTDFDRITIFDEKGTSVKTFAKDKSQNRSSLMYGNIKYSIYYDDQKKNFYGTILFRYKRVTSQVYFFIAWLLLALVSIPLAFKGLKIINRRIKKDIEHQKLSAIGQVTSMLAHDVRKPFSMVKSILNILDSIKDNPSDLFKAKEDVNNAIKSVESMISDIMDYSRESTLQVEPKSVPILLTNSINQIKSDYTNVDINFDYTLANRTCPLVDEDRFIRVLNNIIGNAIEAITIIGKKDSGNIVFTSTDKRIKGKDYIELTIANNGPQFKEESIPNLFSSCFTSGKKKGTGLGLASAQKIVQLHNGKIWARNRDNGDGVEFVILIPSSDIEQQTADSDQLFDSVRSAISIENQSTSPISGDNIQEVTANLGSNRIKILLLEDEALYRVSVRNTINSDKVLSEQVVLYEAQNVDDAIKIVESENIQFAIVDIDLGLEKNGFDFLKEAKGKFPKLKSIVHSNRCIEEDKKKAIQLGACAIASKPLNLSDLVNALADSKESEESYYDAVYIEDDYYLRLGWQSDAKKNGVTLLTMESTKEFETHANQISKSKTAIYIDRELGPDEPKGEEFAQTLHGLGYKNLSMATGYDADQFEHLPWLKVTDKDSPWSDEDDW